MSDFSTLKTKVNALKSKVQNNSITPQSLGTLLDEIITVTEAACVPVPNMVGKFSADSSPDDWFWYPNGQKTAIPVDPATGEFSYTYDGEFFQSRPFNPKYELNSGFKLSKLERWDKMPSFSSNADTYMFFIDVLNSNTLPVIDCKNLGRDSSLTYMFCNNSEVAQVSHIAFSNTQNVRNIDMLFNLHPSHKIVSVIGLDLSGCTDFKQYPLGVNSAPYIELKNLGKPQTIGNGNMLDCRSKNWGNDLLATGARQSFVDSLLTNSFNRAAYGYETTAIYIYRCQYKLLTPKEISGINAKGFDLVIDDTY